MFPNLQHQSPPHSAVQQHLITTTSGEDDTNKESNTTHDGGPVQVVRRPRGRPPGSRNKRKSSVSVTSEPDPGISPYVLEVSDGSDIVAAVMQFCNHRKTSLCVLSGSGAVSHVSFRLPTASTARIFQGRFNLLSISATIIQSSSPTSTNSDFLAKFVVSLADLNGKTFGGAVVGPLIASGTVYIVAITVNNPLYHRLPMEDDDDHVPNAGYGSVSAAIDQSPGSGGGESGQHHAAPAQSTVMELLSMYGCHLPADFRWPSTPRQAPLHSSPY